MGFEEEYEDVLQNIEASIISVYHEHPEMTDYAVMHSLEAIINHYVSEKIGRQPKTFSLDKTESEIYKRVKSVCDWRLGYPSAGMPEVDPKTQDEIIQCLKRILKSAQRWHKHGGRQGYLHFVSQFVP